MRQSSRLAQNETNKRHLQIYTRGAHVYKKFGRKYYQGIICDFDTKERYYKVKYNDGDAEEYTKDEIKNIAKQTRCKKHPTSNSSNETWISRSTIYMNQLNI